MRPPRNEAKLFDPQEKYIEDKVCKAFVKAGWLSRKCSWVGRNGAPDRLFIKRGVFVFVEFKQRGKKSTPLQTQEQQRLREAGCKVFVIDSIESGLSLLDELDGAFHGGII